MTKVATYMEGSAQWVRDGERDRAWKIEPLREGSQILRPGKTNGLFVSMTTPEKYSRDMYRGIDIDPEKITEPFQVTICNGARYGLEAWAGSQTGIEIILPEGWSTVPEVKYTHRVVRVAK